MWSPSTAHDTPTCRSVAQVIISYVSSRVNAGTLVRYSPVPQELQDDVELGPKKLRDWSTQTDNGMAMVENGFHDADKEREFEGDDDFSPYQADADDIGSDGDESVNPQAGEPLDEDLYGASITSLIRDLYAVWHRPKAMWYILRVSRVAFTMLLLTLTVLLVVLVLAETKIMITPEAVKNMRETYSIYEELMYNNHTYRTVHGYTRGVRAHFDPTRFSVLPTEMQSTICEIPLAHPYFLGIVLSIWTLTVAVDLRTVCRLAQLLTCRVSTVSSVQQIFTDANGNRVLDLQRAKGNLSLDGLTCQFKVILMLVIFLPRLFLDICLLILGCRLLIATQGLENLLLNAVALEFVLGLKDLLYRAVVPYRTMQATREMLIRHSFSDRPRCLYYLGSFLWMLLVAVWVYLYMRYVQGVLPDFNWDVSDFCNGGVQQIEKTLKKSFNCFAWNYC